MGSECSCGVGRPCSSGGQDGGGPPAPGEYEPQRGAAEEDQDLNGEEFSKEKERTLAAMAASTGEASEMGAMVLERGQRPSPIPEHTEASETSPSAAGVANEECRETQDEGGQSPSAPSAKTQALARLAALLTSGSAQSAADIEAAVAAAEKASAEESELAEARKRVSQLKAVEAMDVAAQAGDVKQLHEAITRATELGVPENIVAQAMEVLTKFQAEKKRREEEAKKQAEEAKQQAEEAKKKAEEEKKRVALQKKQAAAERLIGALAEKDIAKLKAAIEEAELHCVPSDDINNAQKVLLELEKKAAPRKRGMFGRGSK